MGQPIRVRARPDILFRHADHAAHLGMRRRRLMRTNLMPHGHRCRFDARLDAHLQGLYLGGADALSACRELFSLCPGPGEYFVAMATALACGDIEDCRAVVVAQPGPLDPDYRTALAEAGAMAPGTQPPAKLRAMAPDPSPQLRYLAVAGLALRRFDPGAALGTALHDPDPFVVARAAQATAELGRTDLLGTLWRCLTHPNRSASLAATLAMARLGDRSADLQARLLEVANEDRTREGETAIVALALAFPEALLDRVAQWLAHTQHQRSAIVAVEALGDMRFLPQLLGLMDVPELARLAGQAFETLTGLALGEDELALESGMPATSDTTAPDFGLPLPSRLAIERRLRSLPDFEAGPPYLGGVPAASPAALNAIALRGRAREQRFAALRLGYAQPTEPLIETRALAVGDFTGRERFRDRDVPAERDALTLAVKGEQAGQHG